MMPMTQNPSYVPSVHHPNPGHEVPSDSMVLDLSMKKDSSSPNYSFDYKTPSDMEYPRSSPKSEASPDIVVVSKDCDQPPMTGPSLKVPRPFEAYTKNMLAVPLISTTIAQFLDNASAEAYSEFRRKKMIQSQTCESSSNRNTRRGQYTRENTDPTYLERRKKNNEAAKRSREAKKAMEDEIAIRCAFLEQENIQLRLQLDVMETEIAKLQSWLGR